MLKNYFKTAWRNLLRGKSFSIINISGLAIGMAGAMLILLWIVHELSYDRFHKNKDQLYQVYGLNMTDGKLREIDQTSQPLAPALMQEFPEVTNVNRYAETDGFLLTVGDKRITGTDAGITDASFLEMFSFPVKEGMTARALADPASIVITEKLAKKLFGSEDALHKTIRIDSADHFTVTAILKDLPSNTRFSFEYLLPWSYMKKTGADNDSWLSNNILTFVQLRPNTNAAVFDEKIKNFSRVHSGNKEIWTHFVHPLSKWRLYSGFENGKASGGRIETVRLFGIVAGFILLIACINFMNLSTARSEKRAREVGIRKVAGAGKGLLIRQFIIESFVVTAVAASFSFLLVAVVLGPFSQLINAQLSIPYTNPYFWLALFGFVLFTSLLAGSYPAFYLSSFNPVGIFRGKFRKTQALLSTRKVLVVTQFTFAVILIISTIVVREQIRYAQDRDKGFSEKNLFSVYFSGDIGKNYEQIRYELMNQGIAASVTKTMTNITRRGANTWGLRWEGRNPDGDETIALYSTDADLVKTAGLKLVEGRDIDIRKYPSDSTAVLINETAAQLMNFKNPVGRIISQPAANRNWHIVGVVKDYMISSPYEKIPPVVIEGPASWFGNMLIKLNPALSTAEGLRKAEAIFKEYNTAYPFDYQFVDEDYAKHFENEQRTKTFAGLFAGLAIFISCLGLFGLAAYVAEQRTKEIGIRKVLGASASQIWLLLSRDFVVLVLLSCAIASPIAWFSLQRWLQQYHYRISPGAGVFIMAGSMAMLITLFTISFQAIKAAWANPVTSLHSE